MNEAEIASRGQRADTCYNDFIGPCIKDARARYAEVLANLLVTEMSPARRAEAIDHTAKTVKVLDYVDNAIRCLIEDGKMAQNAILRIDEIDKMTAPKRRLFDYVPH